MLLNENDNKNEKKEQEVKQQKELKNRNNSLVRVSIINGLFKIIGIIIVAVLLFLAINYYLKKDVTNISISSVLKDSKTISILQTLQVPYNSILRVEEEKKDENEDTKYKYVTAYNGTVTFGIDFEKIAITEDNDNKQIIVSIPDVKITETYIDPNSVETIYLEDKESDSEFSYIDRRKECDEDLKYKANNDQKVINMAKETAKSTIKNLLGSIAKRLYPEYELIVK